MAEKKSLLLERLKNLINLHSYNFCKSPQAVSNKAEYQLSNSNSRLMLPKCKYVFTKKLEPKCSQDLILNSSQLEINKCPSTIEWINKLQYIYMIKYLPEMQINNI